MSRLIRRVAPLVAAIAGVVVTASAATSSPLPPNHRTEPSATATVGPELGAYEWNDATWWPDPAAYGATLTTLKNLGVTTLYVDVTDAVTLTRDHSKELGSFDSDFATLVGEAHGDGLRVDAVGGDNAWATTARQGPTELLSAVAQMVAFAPGDAPDGVQFDVEPWGLRAWRSHRAAYARDWVTFIRSAVTAWQADGLSGRLGFTVPYWFDGATGGVGQVTVDGATNYPFQLALGALSSLSSSVLNVMAYRNTTTGPNGSSTLFAGNIDAAMSARSSTVLLAGQETGNVSPAETTFYGTGCASFESAGGQISDAFDGDTDFAGIAVDDVESLEALCPS